MAEPSFSPRAPFHYVPTGLLGGRDHVMVDGAPRPGTACTLSHWPGTPTPEALCHDVSAGIVLSALARPELLPSGVDVATVDHFDADGVLALGLLCIDGLAAHHGPLVVAAARVGDFDVVRDRTSALVAFGVGALGHVERSAAVLGAAFHDAEVVDRTAWATTEALRILPGLLEDPERHRALWCDEADAYEASTGALADGWATLEERPGVDLAIVRVDVSHPEAAAAAWDGAPLHAGAVHSATERLRVATLAGGRVEVRYRYESWVRLVSRRPRPRVDLASVASELTGAETAGARWVFDGAGAITPALHLADEGPSSLDPEHVVAVVCDRLEALDQGPPAWDPYTAPTGAG